MVLSNWLELSVLLLIITAGIVLWRVCKRKLKRSKGFEGIFKVRGRPPARNKMDVEEEIERLEKLLGKK